MNRNTSAWKTPFALPGRLVPLRCTFPARLGKPRCSGVQPPPAGQEAGAEGREVGDGACGTEGDSPGSPTGESCLPWRLTPVSPLPSCRKQSRSQVLRDRGNLER